MSEEISPDFEKMDTSETSEGSCQDYSVLRLSKPEEKLEEYSQTHQVLRLSKPVEKLDNEILDNKQYEETTMRTFKNTSMSQNATDSHPLMFSPGSPISPDYPDLIPEKPVKRNHGFDKHHFNPVAHSSHLDATMGSYEHLNLDLPKLEEYRETLPGFPESPSALKKTLMYEMPLEISQTELSDNENDKSVYEAHLSSNLQNVSLTMNEKEGNLNFLAHGKQSNKLRRIKVVPTEVNLDSDISSLDSSPDSLKSEDVFAGMPNTEDDLEFETEQSNSRNESPEPIEPLSADDERRHARHWQRMILPGGEQRTIDMRVIEPYKRVLSHGGYLRAGGHTAIVIFSACFLPDKSRCDYDYVMENLFLYVLWTLERLVTEDYVLVYLHGGATRLPSFSWLKRCYQMVGRKLRKNLSHLYLVHPTLWIKTMLFMAKPFISAKFYRKISFVTSLKELRGRVPLELAAVPEKVKAYDSLHCST